MRTLLCSVVLLSSAACRGPLPLDEYIAEHESSIVFQHLNDGGVPEIAVSLVGARRGDAEACAELSPDVTALVNGLPAPFVNRGEKVCSTFREEAPSSTGNSNVISWSTECRCGDPTVLLPAGVDYDDPVQVVFSDDTCGVGAKLKPARKPVFHGGTPGPGWDGSMQLEVEPPLSKVHLEHALALEQLRFLDRLSGRPLEAEVKWVGEGKLSLQFTQPWHVVRHQLQVILRTQLPREVEACTVGIDCAAEPRRIDVIRNVIYR